MKKKYNDHTSEDPDLPEKRTMKKSEERLQRAKKSSKKYSIVMFSSMILVIVIIFFIMFNPGTSVGEAAPDFSISDIDGNQFSLADYRGEVVILDLMATWCGPCIKEMEHLNEIHDKYNGSGVNIISIDIDSTETIQKLRDFKDRYGGDWVFAMDSDGVGSKYNVKYIPKIVIIDKDGKIRFENEGVTPTQTLSKEIDKLI